MNFGKAFPQKYKGSGEKALRRIRGEFGRISGRLSPREFLKTQPGKSVKESARLLWEISKKMTPAGVPLTGSTICSCCAASLPCCCGACWCCCPLPPAPEASAARENAKGPNKPGEFAEYSYEFREGFPPEIQGERRKGAPENSRRIRTNFGKAFLLASF